MAESIIVQTILGALSSSDPALTASSSETARYKINCDSEKAETLGDGSSSVVFPSGAAKPIPSGGCIIKQANIETPKDSKTIDLFVTKLSLFKLEVSNLEDKNITNIYDLKKEITNIFYNIFYKDGITNEIAKVPDIFFSIYKTDSESDYPPTKGTSVQTKIVSQFHCIPSDVIFSLVELLYKTKYKSLLSGKSGIAINFDDYQQSSIKESEEDLIKLILEFIPFFNYSEDELYGETLFSGYKKHGGYFIVYNNSAYIKLPDISARDYRATFSNFYEDDFASKFLMQYYFLRGEIGGSGESRNLIVENMFLDFEKVFGGEVIYDDGYYPFGDGYGPLKVQLTGFNLSSDLTPYLSIILENKNYSEKIQGYNDTDQQFIDLHPCPNPEYFINSKEIRKSAVSKSKLLDAGVPDLTFNKRYEKYLEQYVKPEDSSVFSVESAGPPTYLYDSYAVRGNGTAYDIFGDLSRQDELLAAKKSGIFNLKKINVSSNYFSSKAMNSSAFGLQIRPRIYQNYHIPSSWLKGSIKQDSKEEGVFEASFPSSVMNKIKAANFNFALYLADKSGQVYRISNSVVSISSSLPSVNSLSPSGYIESGVVVLPGSTVSVSGEDFIPSIKVRFGEQEITPKNVTPESFSFVVPDLLGKQTVTFSNGDNRTDEAELFVAKPDTSVADLPSGGKKDITIFNNSIIAKNLGEIPISYDYPNSKIYLQAKKSTFKKEFSGKLKAYLYIKPSTDDDKKIINFISNDAKLLSFNSSYIFNDISWTLSSDPGSDFVFLSKKKAIINFPGASNSSKPLQYLTSISDKADVGFYITTAKANDVSEGNSLMVTLKEDGLPIFSKPPHILGLAGSTDDFSTTEPNYFQNFENKQFSDASRSKILNYLKEELMGLSGSQTMDPRNPIVFGPIRSISNLNKLVIFFNSVSSIPERTQKYKFYINNSKISGLKTSALKRISSNIWAVTISNYNTSSISNGYADVFVSRKDKWRKNEFDSKNLYFELTSDNNDKDLVATKESGGITSAYLTKNLLFPNNFSTLTSNSIGSSGLLTNNLFNFGGVECQIFANNIKPKVSNDPAIADFTEEIKLQELELSGVTPTANDRKNSNVFNPIKISSLNSDAILYPGLLYENKLELSNIDLPYFESKELTYLPLYLKIEKDSLLTNYNKATISEFVGSYKSYHRFKVNNHATIISNTPRIIEVDKTSVASGDQLRITFEGVNTNKIKVYVDTDRAKIVERKQNQVLIIVPKGIDDLTVVDGKCAKITVKPTSGALIAAEGDLGVTAVNQALAAIGNAVNGFISDRMGDVQVLIDKIKEKFLKFISLNLDKVNIAKELINSFCDMSFHLTAELNLYLKNFSILLIPVKVIFCIIDVICSLLNPVKLASAIIRLFECLYDLLLMLPQIAIPVLILQLFLHLLELLECLIEKIINTIAIITIVIGAIDEVSRLIDDDKVVDFKYLMMLEGVLLDNFLTIEADLQVLGPIVQILAIVLELLQLVFRFPCNIGPQSGEGNCGIDGSMLSGMLLGAITNDDNTLKTQYLLPVAQTYSEDISSLSDDDLTISEVLSLFSGTDPNIKEPTSGSSVLTRGSEESFYDILTFDSDNYRLNQNNNVSFVSSYSKVIKSFSHPQNVKIQFKGKGDQTFFNKYIDHNSPIDSVITLLNKSDNNSLVISNTTSPNNRNFYSMVDAESFIDIVDLGTEFRGNVKPLALPIEIDGTTVERIFTDIPKMVLMDDQSNFYSIDENGIVFDSEYKIKTIFAKIINTNAASNSAFTTSSEESEIDGDGDGVSDSAESFNLYNFPKLYFVDVRAASESIQTQCSTSSLNNILLEQSDPDETSDIVTEVNDCLNKFINSITGKIRSMRDETALGKVPTKFEDNFIGGLAEELRACINGGLDKICKQVVNTLNTSFKVLEDSNETPLGGFPDLVVPDEIMGDFTTDGPPLTGAREYAAGIGDSATVYVNSEATIQISPRDSYDDIITGGYDMSEKIDIQIISDTTGNARIVSKESNGTIKNVISDGNGNYYAYITSNSIGKVKIKAKICNRSIQALTYAGLENTISPDSSGTIDCIPDSAVETTETPIIPLGALARVDRILTIEFIEKTGTIITVGSISEPGIITTPGMFGVGLGE